MKIIDLSQYVWMPKPDSYLGNVAEFAPADARIGSELLTGMRECLPAVSLPKLLLVYDPVIAQKKNGRPFGIEAIREIRFQHGCPY